MSAKINKNLPRDSPQKMLQFDTVYAEKSFFGQILFRYPFGQMVKLNNYGILYVQAQFWEAIFVSVKFFII